MSIIEPSARNAKETFFLGLLTPNNSQILVVPKHLSGLQRHYNQRELGQGCMKDALRSEISFSKWCHELQQWECVLYHDEEEHL